MNIEIAEYSASLALPNLGPEAVRQIKGAASELLGDIEVLVTPSFLDFDYSGRDTGRKVVKFLYRAAALIGSAEGEVECRLITATDELHLEFYAIQNFHLYRQEAKLIRMPSVEVSLESSGAGRALAAVG